MALDTRQLEWRVLRLEKGGAVSGVGSVNGQTGVVNLTADDVGAYSKALGDKLATVTNPRDLGYSNKAALDANFAGMDFNAAVNAMDRIYKARFPDSELRISYFSWVLGEYPNLEKAMLPDGHITDANTNVNLIVFGQNDPTGNTVNMKLTFQTAPAVVGQGGLKLQEWVATVFVPETLKSKSLWHLSAGEGTNPLADRTLLDSGATYIKASPTSTSTLGVRDKSDGVVIELGSSDNPDHQNVIIRGSRKADPDSGTWLDSLEFGMYGSKPPTVFGVGLLKSNWGEVVVDGFNWLGVDDSAFAGLTMPQGFALVSQKWDEYLTNFRYGKYGARKLIATWTYSGGDYDVMESVIVPPNANFASGDIVRFEVIGDSTSVYARLDNITQDKYYFMTFKKADVANMTPNWWKEMQAHNVGKTLPQQPDADGKYVLQKSSGVPTWVPESAGSGSGGLTQAEADKLYLGKTGDQILAGSLQLGSTNSLHGIIGKYQNQVYFQMENPDPNNSGELLFSTLGGGNLEKAEFRVKNDNFLVNGKKVLLTGDGLSQSAADARYLQLATGGTVTSDIIVRGEVAADSLGMQEGSNGGLNIAGDSTHTNITPVDGSGNEVPLKALRYSFSDSNWYIGSQAFPDFSKVETGGAYLHLFPKTSNDPFLGIVNPAANTVRLEIGKYGTAAEKEGKLIVSGQGDHELSSLQFKMKANVNPTVNNNPIYHKGNRPYTVGSSAPASPSDGDLWIEV